MRKKDSETTKFAGMPWHYEYQKRIGYFADELPKAEREELYNNIGRILTCYKNDDSRTIRLKELGLEDEDIDKLLELTPSKFLRVSVKAMKKIVPYLEEGMIYNEACDAAGYDFKADGTQKKASC